MIYAVVTAINITALVMLIARRSLPRPFPWIESALLAFVLLFGGIRPGADIARGVAFVTLLSAFIVMSAWHGRAVRFPLAVLLTLFLLADAFRLIPSPDVTMSDGEIFGIIRRPYLLEHPNLKAAWLLLLSITPVTLIGIIVAQSRGALLGYIVGLSAYIVPRRYYVHALIVCIGVISVAAFVRPGTFFWRWDAWMDALHIVSTNPILGHGTGTYIQHAATGMYTAHNAVLTIAAENGLLGVVAFALWIIPIARMVIRSKSVLMYNLLAFAIQQMVDDQWLSPVSAILLGALLSWSSHQVNK